MSYWNNQLQQIVGKRVVSASMESVEGFDELTPVIQFEGGLNLLILQDEEGNGPGRFKIYPDQ